MESDWKKFTALLPILRERYLAEHNAHFARMLTDPAKTPAERFWDTLEKMKAEARTLHQCLDGYSRSSMVRHLHLMRGVGMLKKEDLAHCSAELQQQIFG